MYSKRNSEAGGGPEHHLTCKGQGHDGCEMGRLFKGSMH
jgi:hypothetical protein